MEDYWIDVEPTVSAEVTRQGIKEQLFCKVKFRDCLDVVLDDADVEYLMRKLGEYQTCKKMAEKICLE